MEAPLLKQAHGDWRLEPCKGSLHLNLRTRQTGDRLIEELKQVFVLTVIQRQAQPQNVKEH